MNKQDYDDCGFCGGTGEGMYDGQSCAHCHGSGVDCGEVEDDFDEPFECDDYEPF